MKRFEHDLYPNDGDLSHCKVCGGAEGSLPTLCPERRMTESEERAVYAGQLDFNHSAMTSPRWWRPLAPVDMILECPACHMQHVDKDNTEEVLIETSERGFVHGTADWERWVEAHTWTNPPHRSHLCSCCGFIWRPADVPTNGVQHINTKGSNDS